jgi:alkylation response protein AidB-like acyl-CoA dehydrogenase
MISPTEPPFPVETPEYQAGRAFGRSVPLAPHPGDPRTSFRETWKKAADCGLFELLIPRGALDGPRVLGVLEGLGEGCGNGGFLLALGAHCFGVGAPLAEFGHDTHGEYLSVMRDGSAVAAFAATEPQAGSDVMSLTTRFQRDGDSYVVHGVKSFVTNVRDADFFLVLATKDPRLHSRGVSAFLIPSDAPGVKPGADEQRLGLSGCSIGSLSLDRVVVPESALLGRFGGGAAVLRHAMLWERSLIVVAQLGILRRQLNACLARAKGRRQFRRPIGSNQYVAGRVVDILARYVTSRLLVEDTVTKLAAGSLTPGQASLTKLYVSEARLAAGLDAFRIHGGSGLLDGSQIGDDLRDAFGGIVYSGTSDLQKVIVAAELGLDG